MGCAPSMQVIFSLGKRYSYKKLRFFLKASIVYSVLLKILGILSLAFCCLIMIPRIIEVASNSIGYSSSLIWEIIFITFLMVILSSLVIGYSKFLSEKFDRINKLALFLSISILLIILGPFINHYSIPLQIIFMSTFSITTFIISFSLTSWTAKRYKNPFIFALSPFFYGLMSFVIFAFFIGLTCRDISGEASLGVGLIVLIGGGAIAIISAIINILFILSLPSERER
jgi:hypothetical protein